ASVRRTAARGGRLRPAQDTVCPPHRIHFPLDRKEAAAPVAEVVIQGAGIIGCAVAYELARRGARVTVIESREPGQGATQASAEILAPFMEALADTPLQRLCVESLGLYESFVNRVRTTSGIDVEYRRTGSLEVALDEAEAKQLDIASKALAAKGIQAELLDAGAALSRDPSLAPATVGALFIPEHGYVAAPMLTQALAAAARTHGATFQTRTRVERVSADGPGGGLR